MKDRDDDNDDCGDDVKHTYQSCKQKQKENCINNNEYISKCD